MKLRRPTLILLLAALCCAAGAGLALAEPPARTAEPPPPPEPPQPPQPPEPVAPPAPPGETPGVPPQELALGTMKVVTGREFLLPDGAEARGDIYIMVNRARVEGQVDGDLFVGAENVLVPGRVMGDVDAAAAKVKVCGTVGGRLRTFAAATDVCGEIGTDVVVFGFDFTLEPGAVVRGSLAVFAGNAKLDGEVDGPVYIGAGRVEINGKVAGDVTVKCDELTFGPAARLEGNLVYQSRSVVNVPPGAVAGTVTRKVEEKPAGAPSARALSFWRSSWFWFLLRIWLAFVALVAGGLLLLFFRPLVDGALGRADTFHQVAACFGIGLVTLLAMLVVGVVCCLFFPLALAVWSALGALIYFGGLVGKIVFGLWALRPLRRTLNPLTGLLVGVGLLFVITLIPILGDLIWFVVTVTGMGAAVLQVRGAAATPSPPPAPAIP